MFFLATAPVYAPATPPPIEPNRKFANESVPNSLTTVLFIPKSDASPSINSSEPSSVIPTAEAATILPNLF